MTPQAQKVVDDNNEHIDYLLKSIEANKHDYIHVAKCEETISSCRIIITATEAMEIIVIKELKIGDTFKRTEGAKKTYERGVFCRTNKAYECINIDDINNFIYLKSETKIVIN